MTEWREIAWNSIRFNAPADWDIGKIDLRYLLLESNHRPAFEIKWAPVKGRFSHKRHLRRLSAGQNRQLRKTFKVIPISNQWRDALTRFEATGFEWQGTSTSAQGVILYCKTCHTATLLQFFNPTDVSSPTTTITRLLTSFTDHESDQWRQWSVFDIHAAVPTIYSLARFRFHAGEFRLEFICKPQRLTLFRWSPAATLVPDGDLERFARSSGFISETSRLSIHTENPFAITGAMPHQNDVFYRIMCRLKRQIPFGRFRLWYLNEQNRLLGVRMTSKRPIDVEGFQTICQNYHVV